MIVGDGAGAGEFWAMLQATPPTDTEVVWLNAGDIATSADVDAMNVYGIFRLILTH